MTIMCNKCQREFAPENLDQVLFHETHMPFIVT